jgi:hypothetical protein
LDLDLAGGALGLGVGCSEEQAASAQPGPTDYRRAPIHYGMNAHSTPCPCGLEVGHPHPPRVPFQEATGPARPQFDFGADSAFCFFFPCHPLLFFIFCAATERCTKASRTCYVRLLHLTNKQLLLYDALQKELRREKEKKSTEKSFVGFEPTLSACKICPMGALPGAQWPVWPRLAMQQLSSSGNGRGRGIWDVKRDFQAPLLWNTRPKRAPEFKKHSLYSSTQEPHLTN